MESGCNGSKRALGAMRGDELASAREIRQPIQNNNDIANAFDDITYEKGAAVIEMFERWIGEAKFREGVQLYLKQHAWGNATASDFEAAMSSAAGENVAPAFNSFLDQPGVPEVSVALKCDDSTGAGRIAEAIAARRVQAKPQTWQIPICVAFESDGSVHHQCSLLSDPKEEIALTGAQTCPRGFWPMTVRTAITKWLTKAISLKKVLADQGSHLSVAERVGVFGDVDTLASEGEISAQVALALVPEFSEDPDWHVVQTTAGIAALLKGGSVPANLREKGVRFISQEFGEKALALGWLAKPGDTEDTRLLRQKLVPFVAGTGEEKALIEQAEMLARQWLATRRGFLQRCWSPCFASLPNSETATYSMRFEQRLCKSASIMFARYCSKRLVRFAVPNWRGRRSICCCRRISILASRFIRCFLVRCPTRIRAMFRLNL